MVMANMSLVCHDPRSKTNKLIWYHGNPLKSPTALLLLQLSAISLVSQLIDVGLKPLGQSSIVSQIFSGMVFGPSLLGHKGLITSKLFPTRGAMLIETMATFGLMFFLFGVSVRMDLTSMVRPGKQAMTIGLSVFFFTTLTAGLSAFFFARYVAKETSLKESLFSIAESQTLTGFPVIACLLTELNMLNTNIGRLALSSAMFCDLLGISLTAVALAVMGNKGGGLRPAMAILSSIALVIGIVFIVKPAILWALNRAPKDKPISESFIRSIFLLVLVIGLLSETIGQHYVFGPLVLGLVVPDGPPLGVALISKTEALTSLVFYPTYLSISGLRTNIFKVGAQASWIVSSVVILSCTAKLAAVMAPAMYGDMPVREAFVLGLIMNAKGIVELNLYNLWKESKVLSDEEFALSVLSVIVVTAIVTPLIKYLYDPSWQYTAIKRSTIQHAKREADLRILVGIHNHDNVPAIVNLLEVSHASEESKIAVIAIVLVELVGRATPVLVAHQPYGSLQTSTTSTSQIINALRQYEDQNEGFVTVQSFTSISPYVTMHNDVCRVGVDKRATIVIVPFHKQWAIDGSIGSVNRAIQGMNINILDSAPCSVGILVDRGILRGSMPFVSTGRPLYHVAVIYIGGADDAESLAYGARMAQSESVDLTVVRFLLFGAENTKERKLETDLIDEYRQANVGNERFVVVEEVVRDGLALSVSIKEMVDCFDLILVGRNHQPSPLITALGEWCECPELGIIGDMLASPDLRCTSSVLVIQQQRMGTGKLMQHSIGTDRNQLLIHDVPLDEPERGSWRITMDRSSIDRAVV
ncbi:cation/H(+) antiporter 15-like [Juglans microcarpa x Juglans regia]|uniref:cation/H(+) antiporter 15-like n=1 Tax=Juglans microcarpa x Juglans regia TaxID=2249226 RepID=UPI001B7E9B1D|nr:cation/H(+) antiporter 15-like [Juglans microcarpa x Juglans regia]